MKATTVLVRQHRRIEQLIAVLEHERFFRASLLLDLFEEVTAHFETERSVLFRDPEWGGASRMRAYGETVAQANAAVRNLIESVDDDDAFSRQLVDLRRILREHIAVEEGAVLPALETSLSEQAQEALGREVEELHAAILRSCRMNDAASRLSALGRDPRPAAISRRRPLSARH